MDTMQQLLRELLAYARQCYYRDPTHFQRQAVAWAVLTIIVLGATTAGFVRWVSRPSAHTLFIRATTSTAAAEQTAATQALKRRYPTSPYLVRLATESTNPDVVSLAIATIEGNRIYSAITAVFTLLGHENPTVRSRAKQAAATLLGRDYGYPVHGSGDDQQAVLTRMQQDWETLKDSELFHYNHSRFQ